jgi:photosystem II stability/assembly factor-like uncharacterized protein
MTDSAKWNSSRTKVWLQPRGPGFPLSPIDVESDAFDGLSGGETTFATEFAEGKAVRRRKTGNPSDRQFNLMSRTGYAEDQLRELARRSTKDGELFGVLTLAEVQGGDPTTFRAGFIFTDATLSMPSYDKPLRQSTTGDDSTPMQTFSGTASIEEEVRQLVHLRSGVTTVNAAINHVIPISDRDNEYLMVGDSVSPATTPRLYYYRLNEDGTKTFKTLILNTITNGVAERVALYGDRVLIAASGTSAGMWAASLTTIKALATGANLSATQVSASVISSAPNDVRSIGRYVLACGNSGAIWISRDGGFSFTLLGTPTANNLTRIAGVSDNDVWFGGASGTLVRWYLGNALTVISPSVITGDNVTSLAIPQRESVDTIVRSWIYLGTNTGEIWYSSDAGVTWARAFFPGDGSGTVTDLQFAGLRGAVLGILHTSAVPATRTLFDYSGGYGGFAVRDVTAPISVQMNSLAATDVNGFIAVGEVNSSLGYVGEVIG